MLQGFSEGLCFILRSKYFILIYMDAVEEVKARLGIEDVVSEYVQLKRAGRNFKGLSPFTSEKTASFIVSPEKQIWHDFSSGKGGDMFSFIMEVEGLDFKAALELLARKAGVDLEEFRPKQSGPKTPSKDRLYAAVEQAVRFYQRQLMKNVEPLKYVREKRGFEKQTLIDFRFGYSPPNGRELADHLQAKGFSVPELKQVGLVGTRGQDIYDMFRGRIMIPLMDAQGRPVGFTARQLTENTSAPKYINTPATILYDKGRQVFGLSLAKEAIRKKGYVVVVEGNLDVVASHQSGVKNVVASAGTALTTYHLKDLKRFTGDIRLAFDEDRAGQEAAARTIPLAQSIGGIDLSIISVPEGKDPDGLIREKPKLWHAVIEQPQYMVDWLMDRIAASVDMASARGKRSFTDEVLAIVRQLKDPVEQEHYVQAIAERTKTSVTTIQSKLSQNLQPQKHLKRIKHTVNEPKNAQEQRVREQHLLSICMKHQSIGTALSAIPLDVFSAEAQETARYILEHPGVVPAFGDSSNGQEYVKMLLLLYEEYYQHTDEAELGYQVKRLASRLIHAYANMKKIALADELSSATEKEQQTLLKAVKQLDDLIVQFAA